MSILIKGIEMPKDGMILKVVADENGTYIFETRSGRCYFVYEVPPHSRLADIDKMASDESEAYMSAQLGTTDEANRLVNAVVHAKLQRLLADTPTVIESEE